MGPRAHSIFCEYWYRLGMVAHAGGYYGANFKGFWGVTQGYPLSPTIFSVVADAVVHHCILLVSGGAGDQDGWGREMRHCDALGV